MNASPSPDEAQHKSINLSRLTAIFAVTFVLAFGLCAVSVLGSMRGHERVAALVWIAVATEAICLLGLLTVAVIAIVRAVRAR